MDTMAVPSLFDVLIIGGGPGGLSVATGLARQLYSALVFDSGVYRNALALHMHNVVGHDHQDPAEYRSKGREDLLKRYNTIQFQDVAVETVKKTEQGVFEATDAQGSVWKGRKLVLAIGVKDVFPDILGYADCWGRNIYHCLFCHGYEDRGVASAGILAVTDTAIPRVAMHMARMAKRLTTKVTIYTHGDPALGESIKGLLGKSGIQVDDRSVKKLKKGPRASEVILEMDDGVQLTEGFLVHKPETTLNNTVAKQLGLDITEGGEIASKGLFYETVSVPGVYVAGDCGATFIKSVPQSILMGSYIAGDIAGKLPMELEQVP